MPCNRVYQRTTRLASEASTVVVVPQVLSLVTSGNVLLSPCAHANLHFDDRMTVASAAMPRRKLFLPSVLLEPWRYVWRRCTIALPVIHQYRSLCVGVVCPCGGVHLIVTGRLRNRSEI